MSFDESTEMGSWTVPSTRGSQAELHALCRVAEGDIPKSLARRVADARVTRRVGTSAGGSAPGRTQKS